MSQSVLMVFSESFDGALQGHTRSLSHLQNFLLVCMGQNICRLLGLAIKNVSIHSVISSFRMLHIFGLIVFLDVTFIIGRAGVFGDLRE